MQQFLALSVVAPNGTRIAQGIKILEVRSWVPAQLPLKDLFIVENQNFLINDGDEEEGSPSLWLMLILFMFGETMRLNLPVPLVGVKDILLGF